MCFTGMPVYSLASLHSSCEPFYGCDFAAVVQEMFCVAAGTAAVVQDFRSRMQFAQEVILYGAEVYGYGAGDEFFAFCCSSPVLWLILWFRFLRSRLLLRV